MTEADDDFGAYFAGRVSSVRRVAYALCGDWHTADDLVQLTFVKLYPRWQRVRDGSVDAYVRRILINTYLTHVRKHQREKVMADVPDRPAPSTDHRDDDLIAALRGLPAQQRAVVVLRHLEDLSIADTAAALRMAEGSVKSQSARGLAALRAAMTEPVREK